MAKNPEEHLTNSSKGRSWLIALGIAFLTFAILSQVIESEFTNWDDPSYVINNYKIKSLDLEKFFTPVSENYVMANYHPLTMLSLALDYWMNELDPKGYHLTALLLHLLNTILVFWFIRNLTNRGLVAIITALLFGIHPLHVEAVAWISARKELMFSLFYLLSLLSYLEYAKGNRRILFMTLTFLFFILSLLSKAVAVSLPLALILIDMYRDRINMNSLLEKIPFVALSIGTGLIAIEAQQSGEALQSLVDYSYFDNFFIACYGLILHLVKVVFPFMLSAFYPYPDKIEGSIPVFLYIMPLIVAVLAYLIYRSRQNKQLVFGSLFFLVTIALVLQFLPVGDAMIADRYTYIPYIGMFFIIGHVIDWIFLQRTQKWKGRRTATVVIASAFIIFIAVQGYQRTKTWKNSGTLWSNVIENYPVAIAYNNRGNYYASKGQFDLAFNDFNRTLELYPNNSEGYNNRGLVYKHAANYDLALKDFLVAIQLDPNNYKAYNNMGNVYREQKKFNAAIAQFNYCIKLNPNYADAYNNRGIIYKQSEMFEEALADFNYAIELNPNIPMFFVNRGIIYATGKNYPSAIQDFSTSIKLYPENGDAYHNRAYSYVSNGQYRFALRDARRARKLGVAIDPEFMQRVESLASKAPGF